MAADEVVRLTTVGRESHLGSMLGRKGTSAASGDAAPPGDDTNDDQHEGEAADKDLRPSTEHLLFVPIRRKCQYIILPKFLHG